MKDVSIEYAHIYTNNKIEQEQELSMQILAELKKDLEAKKESFSLIVLVDDYSFPDPSFDYELFSDWLATKGYKPDIIFRESQLIPLCDTVLNGLKNQKRRTQLSSYIKRKKYPCSLFIAAWYLLRLGYFKHVSFNSSLVAKRLINILPESFKPFENEALDILKDSKFEGAEKLIEYSFIKGRKI